MHTLRVTGLPMTGLPGVGEWKPECGPECRLLLDAFLRGGPCKCDKRVIQPNKLPNTQSCASNTPKPL